ncbi:MAG: hypothetical protein ED557_05400 [Balneola sp.]|nr:MAG: hypothetical protein ED557_05400 [Balneola sp.]
MSDNEEFDQTRLNQSKEDLEKEKLKLEIKNLKHPYKTTLIVTLFTLLISGIINLEPIKREVELRKLENQIAEIELKSREDDLSVRREEFLNDSLKMVQEIEYLKVEQELQRGKNIELGILISKKEDSLIELGLAIDSLETDLKFSIVDTYVNDIKENFLGTPSFRYLFELLNSDISIESRLDQAIESETRLKEKTRLLLLKYRDNLEELDETLLDFISEYPDKVDNKYYADLIQVMPFLKPYIPVFFEEIIVKKMQGDLKNLDEREFLKSINGDLKFKYSLPFVGGTTDLKDFSKDIAESIRDSSTAIDFKNYISYTAKNKLEEPIIFYGLVLYELEALLYVNPCHYTYLIGLEILENGDNQFAQDYFNFSYSNTFTRIGLNYSINPPNELNMGAWRNWTEQNSQFESPQVKCE